MGVAYLEVHEYEHRLKIHGRKNKIGFSNLGDINNHLLAFEQSLSGSEISSPKLVKS